MPLTGKNIVHYPTSVPKNPVISIVVITYNQEKYIEECLESILAQELEYSFEIVIGEDDSPDNTREICERYAEKHPEKIRLIGQSRDNVMLINGKPSGAFNALFCYQEARGKYIAICEGDDYWTDSKKLQKQIDFLEKHPDFNICFHRAKVKTGDAFEEHPIQHPKPNGEYIYDDLLEHGNFMTSASLVFRNQLPEYPEWFKKIPGGDMGVILLASGQKKIKCLEEFMSVYRIHDQGFWSESSNHQKQMNHLLFYRHIYPDLNASQRKIAKEKAAKFIRIVSHNKYPNNRLLRIRYRIWLSLQNKKYMR